MSPAELNELTNKVMDDMIGHLAESHQRSAYGAPSSPNRLAQRTAAAENAVIYLALRALKEDSE